MLIRVCLFVLNDDDNDDDHEDGDAMMMFI